MPLAFQEAASFLEGVALLHVSHKILVGLRVGKVGAHELLVDQGAGAFLD